MRQIVTPTYLKIWVWILQQEQRIAETQGFIGMRRQKATCETQPLYNELKADSFRTDASI